jgi:hypothetical protein
MLKVAAQDVWAWAYVDFLPNAQRGVLAEYIVARAVGATSSPRMMWDAMDVTCPKGVRIEVKSAAYPQAWQQTELSKIRFDIAPKRTWDQASRRYSPSPARTAAVYVFALFETKDRALADPLDLRSGSWSRWLRSFSSCSTVPWIRGCSAPAAAASQSRASLGAVRPGGRCAANGLTGVPPNAWPRVHLPASAPRLQRLPPVRLPRWRQNSQSHLICFGTNLGRHQRRGLLSASSVHKT